MNPISGDPRARVALAPFLRVVAPRVMVGEAEWHHNLEATSYPIVVET